MEKVEHTAQKKAERGAEYSYRKKLVLEKKCWQWVSSSFPRSDDSLFLVFDIVIVIVDVDVHAVANAKITHSVKIC